MPESSANAGSPAPRAACRALASAFSTKVPCGSPASAMPSSDCGTTSMPSVESICRNSRSFPGLLLASTSLRMTERRLLRRDQLAYPLLREVEHRVHLLARERRAFRRALHFHQPAAAGHHDVHVGAGTRVLGVVEIEHRSAAVDADRHRGDEIAHRRSEEHTSE